MRPLLLILLLLGAVPAGCAQTRSERLLDAVARISEGRRATVGFAVLFPGADKPIASGDDDRYPMMSVFKLHVAAAALSRMEREHIPLDERLVVPTDLLRPDTYSPLRDSVAGSRLFRITRRELIRYCISLSDNNACDMLIDFAGGPAAVDSCIRSAGVGDFAVVCTEDAMHRELRNCYMNRTSPSAAVRLLEAIRSGRIVTGAYLEVLMRAMSETETGPDKLRAGIPPEIPLAHKTGHSDRTPEGVKIGDNDAGFFLLPDGSCCYLAVFIRDSREDDAANARTIAEIARRVYAEALRPEPSALSPEESPACKTCKTNRL